MVDWDWAYCGNVIRTLVPSPGEERIVIPYALP